MKVEGEYNTADVKIDDVEEKALEQIQEMMDHEAFVGDDDVAIMPEEDQKDAALDHIEFLIGDTLTTGDL